MGSNAIRLLIVEVSDVGNVVHHFFRRYPLCLGADVFAHDRIALTTIQKLVETFGDIQKQLKKHDALPYRAVATAAMRRAHNRHLVLELIRAKTGIRVEIIDGEEEAQLSIAALLRATGPLPSESLLFDLGGGTLELKRAGHGNSISLPLGTLCMLGIYPQLKGPLSKKEIAPVLVTMEKDFLRLTRMRKCCAILVGTGGNLSTLARLAPTKHGHMPSIDLQCLKPLMMKLAALRVEERMEQYDLRLDQAQSVVTGGLLLLILTKIFEAKTLLVPETGLREAIVHDLMVVEKGVRVKTKLVVPTLAGQLFDALAPIHGLWPAARLPLMLAAQGRGDPMCTEQLAKKRLSTEGLQLALHVTAPSKCVVAKANAPVAQTLAAILRLAQAIVDAKGRSLRGVSLLPNPIQLRCGIKKPVQKTVIHDVNQVLGCTLRVV